MGRGQNASGGLRWNITLPRCDRSLVLIEHPTSYALSAPHHNRSSCMSPAARPKVNSSRRDAQMNFVARALCNRGGEMSIGLAVLRQCSSIEKIRPSACRRIPCKFCGFLVEKSPSSGAWLGGRLELRDFNPAWRKGSATWLGRAVALCTSVQSGHSTEGICVWHRSHIRGFSQRMHDLIPQSANQSSRLRGPRQSSAISDAVTDIHNLPEKQCFRHTSHLTSGELSAVI